MFEIALRLLVLLICAGAILVSGQVAIWTTKVWWRPILGYPTETAVTIEPVGLIEGGKIKQVESRSVASQINHRLVEISNALKRDMARQYEVLRTAGVSIPSTWVSSTETFQLLSDTSVSFEVQVFKFDVAGLTTYLRNKLDPHDRVKSMIEISDPRSRLFLDVARANAAPRRMILDSGPSLNDAIETAACAIAQTYREEDGLFAGLDTNGFCQFLETLVQFQTFIVQSANVVERGGQMNLQQAQAISERLESDPFDTADSPVVLLILASLYRLQGRVDDALVRLERASALVPDHEFVVANLAAWRGEKQDRDAQKQQLAAAQSRPADLATLERSYSEIRNQPALAAIRYPEMLEYLETLPAAGDVIVAIFSTGFTSSPEPASIPVILDAISSVDEPGTGDENGHGNFTTHLLAALTPRDRLSILPVKVLSSTGGGRLEDIAKGFDLAAERGANVYAMPLGLNASNSAAAQPKPVDAALLIQQSLENADAILVAASGNSAERDSGIMGSVDFPASLANVVSVGGAALDGAWASYSPGPEGVDIAAPSEKILTTINGLDLRGFSGTSLSVNIAAALFANAKSVAPGLSQADILLALQETATQADSQGPVRIDALAFMMRIAGDASE